MASIFIPICDFITVFGSAIGYIYQIKEIEKQKSSEGFAPQVSLIVMISMTARIFFYIVKPFALPLLLQAFCLQICQVFF